MKRVPSHETVLITGIGAVLPGADTVATFWGQLRSGRSQFGPVDALRSLTTSVGACLRGFDHRRYLPDLPERHAARYTREELAVIAAVGNTLRDARLQPRSGAAGRIGVIASSSRGPLAWWEQRLRADAPGLGPALLGGLPGAPATLAAIHHGVQGTVTTLSSGCVGGSQAVGIALRELRSGAADAVLVGGHEFPLTPALVTAFTTMGDGVLAPDGPNPEQVMRPYDRRRNGFVLGEGALFLCLETSASASRRGVGGYAQVLEQRCANAAAHPTTMDLTGRHGADLVTALLEDTGVAPKEIGYVCGHGSATHYNDLAESRILDRVFAPADQHGRPPLGSVKPVYGHTLGMAAIVNVAATALMLHHQCLVPTVGCVEVAPECAGDHVTEGARPARLDNALSLAFALGSQTAAVLMSAAPEPRTPR